MTQYFIKRNEKVNGPYALPQIKTGVKSKKLLLTDLVATSNAGPWRPLSDFYRKSEAVETQPSAKLTPPPQNDDGFWDDVVLKAPSVPEKKEGQGRRKDAEILAEHLKGATNTAEKVGLLNLRLDAIKKTEDDWWDADADSAGERSAEKKLARLRSEKGRFKGQSVNNDAVVRSKNKTVAGVLGILLGFLGVHHFYLGSLGAGVICLLLSFGAIGIIIGFVEGILLLVMSNNDFNAKYNARSPKSLEFVFMKK